MENIVTTKKDFLNRVSFHRYGNNKGPYLILINKPQTKGFRYLMHGYGDTKKDALSMFYENLCAIQTGNPQPHPSLVLTSNNDIKIPISWRGVHEKIKTLDFA